MTNNVASPSYCTITYLRIAAAFLLIAALVMPAPVFASSPLPPGSNSRNVIDDVASGQIITHTAGVVEGMGFAPGVSDVELNITSFGGFNRFIDHNGGSKNFIPFGLATDIQSFLQSSEARDYYTFDFVRVADTVSVDYSAGVSNPALLVTGQTLVRNVSTPKARLDTRSSSAFDTSRELKLNDVSLNMQRKDCRHPVDYNTGSERTDLPKNICVTRDWLEKPTLTLTYKPTIRYQGVPRVEPNITATALYARAFDSMIVARDWAISWDAPTGDPVPPVSAPPVGEPCPPTAGHGSHTWLPNTTGNSQVLTGAAASAAPNSCAYGVQSAVRHWDTQQDAICYDSQFYRQAATREVNVSWSNVSCSAPPSCGSGQAITPSGSCVSLYGAGNVTNTLANSTFWPGWMSMSDSWYITSYAGDSAMQVCASQGLSQMHDFGGWGYGKRKSKSDTDFVRAIFNGDRNSAESILNLGNYTLQGLKNKDSEDWGYMSHILCSGPNYLVPTFSTLVADTTDANAVAAPSGLTQCPGDLDLAGNPLANNTYFASTRYSAPNFGQPNVGAQQSRTAYETMQPHAGAYGQPYRPAIAKEQLNCYQRSQYDVPVYDYNAPMDQWNISYWCDYYGCYDNSTPPQVGTERHYSLRTVTTQLFCKQQVTSTPTGGTVANCNGTPYSGTEYSTTVANQGDVCGNNSAPSMSCVPNYPDNGGGGGGGGGGCFTPETLITMADGSKKPVVDLKKGDVVRGETRNNTITGVVVLKKTDALYAFNGGKAFVTGGHPFKTQNGWKAIDPTLTPADKHNVTVTKLAVGDTLYLDTGETVVVKTIDTFEQSKPHTVYNPMMDGDHTYFSGGFLVHNKMNDQFDMNAN